MHVPLTTVDSLTRAELGYGDRVGVIDASHRERGDLLGGFATAEPHGTALLTADRRIGRSAAAMMCEVITV